MASALARSDSGTQGATARECAPILTAGHGRLPAMTTDSRQRSAARAGDRCTRPPRRRGSIVLVLLVAGVLVAAAVGLMTVGRGAGAALYPGHAGRCSAMVGLFNLFAFAAGIVRFADRDRRRSRSMGDVADHAFDGIAVTDPRGHVVYANAAYLALTGRASAAGRAAGRAGLHRRSGRLRSGLSPAQGGARGQAGSRRRCASPAATASRRAGCGCGCARSAQGKRESAALRCGRSPTSPATASGRKTCSRSCSTPSNISIMRRAASSRSMPAASSSMSTRRWPTGSTTTSPRSARAG